MTIPETLQKTIDSLFILYNAKYCQAADNDDFQIFERFIERNYILATEDDTPYINHLENVYKPHLEEFINVNEYQIPAGILPPNKIGFLRDINVIITNKFRKNSGNKFTDDYVYHNYEPIQKNIPRGLTICKITDDETNEIEFNEICIYGNKKFAGMTNQDEDDIDDDDDENAGEKYFIENPNPEKQPTIIAMEKINGEALHFSGRYLYDTFYLFIGSKRNHIMISKEADIHLYKNQRHNQAKKFAKSLMEKLGQLSENKRQILYNLLHYTKVTVSCEILQPSYQHVVRIPGENDKIVFLNFSALHNDDKSLTAFPPHTACNIMEVLNLTPANYEISNDGKKMDKKIRYRENCEGSVLYYLNKNNETIGFLKLKSFWYIFLRALREKLSRHVNDVNKNRVIRKPIEESINNRYDQIQGWLKLTAAETNEWKEIAQKFKNWLLQLNRHISAEEVKIKFPILWDKFLNENAI